MKCEQCYGFADNNYLELGRFGNLLQENIIGMLNGNVQNMHLATK